jgi:8-amino-7-oxononanoate synthase
MLHIVKVGVLVSKRNTQFVVGESLKNYRLARSQGLVNNHIHHREGKNLILDGGRRVVDFINCSYLGLDLHPKVVEAYHSVPRSLGVNFCCARTRLTETNLRRLEERLCELFCGRTITFPSVTTTHMSVMPLIASGILLDSNAPPPVHMVFDRFAHASMQFLTPVLEKECRISVIGHNDLEALVRSVRESRLRGETVVSALSMSCSNFRRMKVSICISTMRMGPRSSANVAKGQF